MRISNRLKAVLNALLVTFLWSTSFVIIKFGLKDIRPVTFAGLRYFAAFLCLLPLFFTKKNLSAVKELSSKDIKKIILLGLLFYALTQGAQFVGLSLLPAVTVSLMLNFTPIVVAVMSIFLISERPSLLQWAGMIIFLSGIGIYFLPVNLAGGEAAGLLVMTIGVLANAGSAVLGREVNKGGRIKPLIVTVISMGVGSVILLASGLAFEGMPTITPLSVFLILWLAAVNTAFAFTLWNKTLQTLTAVESSIINGTMLIQIAVLSFIFLGEPLSLKEIIGLILAGAGAAAVQLKIKKKGDLRL